MSFDEVWAEVRQECRTLDPGTVLVTPSDRAFDVDEATDDRVEIRYRDTDEERTLWRDQFAVLHDRIAPDSEGLSLADLPAGVEPYVSVLSLSTRYAVDDATNALRRSEGGGVETSPFVRSEWDVRAPPERLRDDALLLADQLARTDIDDLGSVPTQPTVDLYVLLSDVQSGADRFRQAVGASLLDRIGPDARLHGRLGSVHRTHRERRRLKDVGRVFEVLDRAGVPREWVVGIDREKLDVVIAVTDVEADDVYDAEEQVYVQKVAVETDEKRARLDGIRDRLDALDTEEADELRDEIQHLEDRLDALLAAG